MNVLLGTIADESEEIKLLKYLCKDADKEIVWKYQCITSNQGLTTPDHPD
jgi:hypothetical protein